VPADAPADASATGERERAAAGEAGEAGEAAVAAEGGRGERGEAGEADAARQLSLCPALHAASWHAWCRKRTALSYSGDTYD